jgi:hypothetical protein
VFVVCSGQAVEGEGLLDLLLDPIHQLGIARASAFNPGL